MLSGDSPLITIECPNTCEAFAKRSVKSSNNRPEVYEIRNVVGQLLVDSRRDPSQRRRLGTRQKAAPLAELAAYTGSDREQRLLAGAKAEGKVVWYTSLAGSSYKELAKGFETKYPGIKVETYRGTSTDIMTRITAEAQAKQILADVLETTVPPLTYLRENKLSCPMHSPFLGKYPASTKENAGPRPGLLDRRSRNLQRRRLQHESYSAVCRAKKLWRSFEARAQRKNRIRFQ